MMNNIDIYGTMVVLIWLICSVSDYKITKINGEPIRHVECLFAPFFMLYNCIMICLYSEQQLREIYEIEEEVMSNENSFVVKLNDTNISVTSYGVGEFAQHVQALVLDGWAFEDVHSITSIQGCYRYNMVKGEEIINPLDTIVEDLEELLVEEESPEEYDDEDEEYVVEFELEDDEDIVDFETLYNLENTLENRDYVLGVAHSYGIELDRRIKKIKRLVNDFKKAYE